MPNIAPEPSFQDFTKQAIRGFLHTALVIDDCAVLTSEPSTQTPSPKIANKPKTSLLARAATSRVVLPVEVKKSNEILVEGSNAETSPETLNARILTDAFMREEVICGVHKPVGDSDSVSLAVRAASRADIVVVDWLLEKHTSVKARSIITKILEADRLELGRLRLIAVYTSEPNRTQVVNDLYDSISEKNSLEGVFKKSDDGYSLNSFDTKICVFNKKATVSAATVLAIAENDLPSVLITEFAKLADGVLPTFAVSAVAAIRRGAHHLLTKFSAEMDGAYLAHRALIPDPADADLFAIDLVVVELSGLIENAGVAKNTLSNSVLQSWVRRKAGGGHIFKSGKAVLPPDLVSEILTTGGVIRLKNKQGQTDLQGVALDASAPSVKEHNVASIFYNDEAEAISAAKSFSRLVTFKREAKRMRAEEFVPELTLGSLLKIRPDLTRVKGAFGNFIGEYILCIQPRCDSVRIEGQRAFPFQQISYDKKRFNLIVDAEGHKAYQNIDTKPMNTLMLDFVPSHGKDSIVAKKKNNVFVFRDKRGRVFEWIGDLVDMRAQRFASDVAANMHRVGMDDFEWLRFGGTLIKPEQPPGVQDVAKQPAVPAKPQAKPANAE